MLVALLGNGHAHDLVGGTALIDAQPAAADRFILTEEITGAFTTPELNLP
jgi:hypothetical protein